VQADVSSVGFTGKDIIAQLTELPESVPTVSGAAEKMVAEQTLQPLSGGEPMAFRFQVRPEKSGIRFYRLRVCAKEELDQFLKSEGTSEATLANNARVITVDRGKGPYRVLYVAGRPN